MLCLINRVLIQIILFYYKKVKSKFKEFTKVPKRSCKKVMQKGHAKRSCKKVINQALTEVSFLSQ